jgi:hypothetical protein
MPLIGFYAAQATRLFELAMEQNRFTFDLSMRRALLSKAPIPGSLILVDEAQDIDACQVHWAIQTQIQHGSLVYVVGDTTQRIYGFCGAHSQKLVDLESGISATRQELPSTEPKLIRGMFRIVTAVPPLFVNVAVPTSATHGGRLRKCY